MFITQIQYDSQLLNGNFLGNSTSSYQDFLNHYHLPFLRYIYFTIHLNSQGPYPNPYIIPDQQIINWAIYGIFNEPINIRFDKILIGEAPNNPQTYFYTSNLQFQNIGWTIGIKEALFPNMNFNTREDFLIACSQKGFLLIDIFHYDINYNNVNGINAAKRYHWDFLINDLFSLLSNFISPVFALAFGLPRIGSFTIEDRQINRNPMFANWMYASGKQLVTLNNSNLLAALRTNLNNLNSRYIRVCGGSNQFYPSAISLQTAGIL